MTVVITEVKRAHEHGWYARGESLPSSTYSGSAKVWDGSTSDRKLSVLLPTCYMTKNVWDGLDIDVKRDIKNKVTAVVESNWLSKGSGIDPRSGRYYTRDFNTSSIIDGYKESSITPPPSPPPEPEPEPPEPEPPTDEPSDDVTDEPTDYDVPTEPTEPDMQFDIQSLLDSMGLSMKHAKYAIVILIIIFIMSRLA